MVLDGDQAETCELLDTLAESAQKRVVGHALARPAVVALHEDRGLPAGERHVPREVADAAAGAALVKADELGASGKAGLTGYRREVEHRGRVGAAIGPCARH